MPATGSNRAQPVRPSLATGNAGGGAEASTGRHTIGGPRPCLGPRQGDRPGQDGGSVGRDDAGGPVVHVDAVKSGASAPAYAATTMATVLGGTDEECAALCVAYFRSIGILGLVAPLAGQYLRGGLNGLVACFLGCYFRLFYLSFLLSSLLWWLFDRYDRSVDRSRPFTIW